MTADGNSRPAERDDATLPTLPCGGAAGDAPTVAGEPLTGATAATAPAARGDPALTLGRSFGKYELLDLLGRGGMGVVYRAWHPELKAFFAIKVLLTGEAAGAEAEERFRREAQALARLRHPAIVAVHDVGTVDGKAYYAMEYVEGVGLNLVLNHPARAGLQPPAAIGPAGTRRGLQVRDAVRIVLDVALAIDHAHAQGVVHRDLKPGNVLIDRTGRTRVLDFGLAKFHDPLRTTPGGGLTRTGEVLGTLAYMPPEQAAGEVHDIDARSDVYALGAMLYEAVTGRPPFDAATDAELLGKVLTAEPARPRSLVPDLPADLETIILKAMERERERRYPRAGGLAEDLRRFLAGEGVVAQPPSATRMVTKWVRRRRGLVAAGAALAVVALVAGLSTWWARVAERQRTGLRAKVLADLQAKAGLYVDAALTLRRSGVPLTKAIAEYLPQLRQTVEEVERSNPDRPEPHYHLGRMLRILLQFEDALAEQNAALVRDPDYAPSRYERAVLLARQYGDRVAALRSEWLRAEGRRLGARGLLAAGMQGGEKMRAQPPDETLAAGDRRAQELKATLVGDLERLEALAGAAAGSNPGRTALDPVADLSPALIDCASGLRLAYAPARPEDRERARARLEAAIRARPTLEEAHEGLAQLEVTLGAYDAAIAAFTRGLEADRGYVPFLVGRGSARETCGTQAAARGQDPRPYYLQAQEDFVRASELSPTSPEPWLKRGGVRVNWGLHAFGRGEDPAALYAQAVQETDQALKLDPKCLRAWLQRGAVHTDWGDARMVRGEDPGPLFAQAEADFQKALDLDAVSVEAWQNRGAVRANWAHFKMGRGEDTEALFAQAEADYGRALELDSQSAETWMHRGLLRTNWCGVRQAHGQDPTGLSLGAEADFGRALELNPAVADTWIHRGGVRVNRGSYVQARGEDPGPIYAQAIADFDRALELNPRSAAAYMTRGLARLNWGIAKIGRGEGAAQLFAQADADYGQALGQNAGSAEAWMWRGYVRYCRLHQGLIADNEAAAFATAALADLDRALALNSRYAEARWRRGLLHNLVSHWAEAVTDFEAALALNPALEPDLRASLATARANVAALGGTAAPAWLPLLGAGDRAVAAGDYATADTAYTQGLVAAASDLAARPAAERARLEADPAVRQALVNAHYNLACVLALRSAGKAGPQAGGAVTRPVTAEEAARLRNEAFGHLRTAVRLGWTDAAHLLADTDLEPLHDDPRWAELRAEVLGKGR